MDLLNKLTQKVKLKAALKSKALKDIERSKFLTAIPTGLLKRCKENNIKDNFM